jgi:uncharacterized protein (DUF2252 family)
MSSTKEHRLTNQSTAARPTPEQRKASGKAARTKTPLEAHAEFRPAESRDPVGLLLRQDETRVPELVPIRHGRMLVSPFSFYRGAALVMAAELHTTPSPGLPAQLCGDAHLSNFGAYASPERELVFDINDFDETLRGPFEWDVKRLGASFVVAGRDNGFTPKQCRKATLAALKSYRTAMRAFAGQTILTVWYAHLNIEAALADFTSGLTRRRLKKDKAGIKGAHPRHPAGHWQAHRHESRAEADRQRSASGSSARRARRNGHRGGARADPRAARYVPRHSPV